MATPGRAELDETVASSGSPIRVVHVMPQIGIGGAETQLHALITRSDPAAVSHQVLYYSDARDDEGLRLYQKAGIVVTRVPRNKRRPVRFVRDLAAAIRAARPDIVHCWLYSGVVWGRLAALRAGIEHIIVAHRAVHLVKVPALRMLERLTGHRVHYLANSRACAGMVADQIGIPAERFSVIYNGSDAGRDAIESLVPELRREFHIPNDCKLALSVGRLTEAKNYPMLLRLARMCKGKLPVRFLIVGHGELEAELRALAAEYGVEGIVHFLGLRRDITRLLRSADVFCYFSRFEGFPNALLEAMTAGLPIITTDFSSARELIEDGRSGTVVGIDDVEAAFAALRRYMEDSSLATKHAVTARADAAARFTMDRMVRETTDYYRGILGRS